MQLKNQLLNMKKGTQTITEYLLKIKSIIDALGAIGQTLPISDHLNYIFNGLSSEYEPFVCSILTRTDNYAMSDVEAMLLTQESRILQIKATETPILAANIAHEQNLRNFNSQRGGRGTGNFNFTPRGRGFNNYFRGGFRGGQNSNNTGGRNSNFICQVCGRSGHVASRCWYRYDSSCSLDLQQYASSSSTNSQNQPHPRPLSQPQAMVATAESMCDPSWYVDSRATNHLSFDDSCLSEKSAYTGSEQIYVGDGTGLSIISTTNCF